MRISDRDLADALTIGDVAELLHEAGYLSQEKTSLIMTGFLRRGAEYKATLVGVPFLIVRATVEQGIDNTTFVELMLIDAENRKATIRDSSLGIHEQILEMFRQRPGSGNTEPMYGIYVAKGLRTEEREFSMPGSNEVKISTTYLLAF